VGAVSLRESLPDLNLGWQGKRPPAFQVVADALRDAILAGRLTFGQRLPTEPELAAEFGVGRSSVREAVRVLASQHLVEVVRGLNGGIFVVSPDSDQISDWIRGNLRLLSAQGACDVGDVLDVRRMLEIPAARAAAANSRPELVTALEQNQAVLREGFPPGASRSSLFEHHIAFHRIILDAQENVLLRVISLPVFFVLRDRLTGPEPSVDFWRCTLGDHEALLKAISAGAEDAAGEAMARHLDNLEDAYRKLDQLRADADKPDAESRS
jgi:GntR family transcriptional repressor for pyruvate dehydrogenase complex